MKDVHEYSKRLEQALVRVRNSNLIVAQDKKLIERFSNVLRAQSLSTGRVEKYVNHLKIIAETLPELTHAKRGLGGATKEDVEQLSIQINESEKYRPHTKSDYVTVLKRFYQWLKVPPEQYNNWRRKHYYPPEVDDLNSGMKPSQRFYPSDLLSEDEVNSMIQAAEWIMVKGVTAFEIALAKYEIRQVLGRVHHPQTNGKVERFFRTAEEKIHHEFRSVDELVTWYNSKRPHMSLNLDEIETPDQAFIRKMPEDGMVIDEESGEIYHAQSS